MFVCSFGTRCCERLRPWRRKMHLFEASYESDVVWPRRLHQQLVNFPWWIQLKSFCDFYGFEYWANFTWLGTLDFVNWIRSNFFWYDYSCIFWIIMICVSWFLMIRELFCAREPNNCIQGDTPPMSARGELSRERGDRVQRWSHQNSSYFFISWEYIYTVCLLISSS